jgi:excisionase family DNA binding protein
MNARNDEPEYLTLAQAGKLLQVSQNTLRNWDRNGTLKAFRLGTRKAMRYKKADLIKFIEKTN